MREEKSGAEEEWCGRDGREGEDTAAVTERGWADCVAG